MLATGAYDRAVDTLRETIEVRTRVLGHDHPDGEGLLVIRQEAIEDALARNSIEGDAFGCKVLGLWPGADTLDRSTRPAAVWRPSTAC